jgi:uncharacterized protein YfaP (DUF2135 family)
VVSAEEQRTDGPQKHGRGAATPALVDRFFENHRHDAAVWFWRAGQRAPEVEEEGLPRGAREKKRVAQLRGQLRAQAPSPLVSVALAALPLLVKRRGRGFVGYAFRPGSRLNATSAALLGAAAVSRRRIASVSTTAASKSPSLRSAATWSARAT